MNKISLCKLLLLLSVIFIFLSCSQANQIDRHGNPIFYASEFLNTTASDWELSVRYYEIFRNVMNPKSSEFIASKPTAEQVIKFALEKPVYNFVVHKNGVVSRLVLLIRKPDEKKWVYYVTTGDGSGYEVPSEIVGEIMEHRFYELTKNTKDETRKILENGEPLVTVIGEKWYRVVSFKLVLAEFESYLDSNKFDKK